MPNREYKVADVQYDKKHKTLVIQQPKTEFMPSYAYYACEYFQKKLNVEIKYVKFIYDNNNYYKVENLKGRYDWEEVDNEPS